MKPIFDDLRKAEEFIKGMEGKDQTRNIAELSHLLFQERTFGTALANAEMREFLADLVRRAIKHMSIDDLELLINHSGKSVRLLRETGKKKG